MFLSNNEKKISEMYLKKGFVLHNINNLEDLHWIRNAYLEIIQKNIPNFTISYAPDFRQKIADTWPQIIDDSKAREDWKWAHKFSLSSMTIDILKNLNSHKI